MTTRNNKRNSNNNNGISFNYSENFNRVTKLNSANYNSWRTNMLYLLDINDLSEYVTGEKIKKVKKNKILNNIEDYVIDKLDKSVVYHKTTDPNDIKNDNLTKWIILNSLDEETKRIIENRGKTAREIWIILENSFTKGKDQLKTELKEKLNQIKYDPSIDIHIFLSYLENIFDELDYLDSPIPDDVRTGILNRSLPENLRFINVFQFRDNWSDCHNYVAKVIPDIIYSNKKENSNQLENKEILNLSTVNKISKRKTYPYTK
ncbi:hypothetical protein PIROE2DRAFT_19366, partial [Piromyces sp. E2]